MIAPNMATMLAFIAKRLPLSQAALQAALFEAADGSFNMISVDGDMSTNDAVYAFAPPGDGDASPAFLAALSRVAGDLALAMVADGEGRNQKRLTIRVTSASNVAQARTVARAIVQQQSGQDRYVR